MAKFDIDFLSDFSEPVLIEELQRIAHKLGQDTLSRSDIDQHGKMSSAVVLKRFGSLRQALQAAGLRPIRFMKASDEELLDILEEVWVPAWRGSVVGQSERTSRRLGVRCRRILSFGDSARGERLW